ncbi:MAG: ATP-binding protein [Prevotella sp.]|nr:ATP-binding protein [Prevotella sp.]
MAARRYPIGIQTFSEMIRGGYVYVDKTDLVWHLTDYAKYIFLARPRRFGKSLLSSTLHSFFAGERELFEGLKIMNLEQEWRQYPVIHLDLSGAKHLPVQGVREELYRIIKPYENVFGNDPDETSPGMRFAGVVNRAYEQTKSQVVVIIDEYDAPLLDVLHDDGRLADMREVMQEFYQRLKMLEPKLKFCFITGITKFSQLSIFSTINNLKNVSMLPRFASICGITEEEVKTNLAEDVRQMGITMGCASKDMFKKIKNHYDGYHFSWKSEDIYNPYSLINAFADGMLDEYWFDSGTPTFLIRQMKHFRTDITSLDSLEVPSSAFDKPTEAMTTALPLLYQSGYLTIKDYERESDTYTLGIPNQEVRVGYTEGLLPAYVGLDGSDVQTGFALKFWRSLKKGDLNQAMLNMQSYLAGIPYVEGFKKKLEAVANAEGFYEYTLYLIFSMLNVYVKTQVKCAGGRADVIVWMPDTIYIIELKVNGTAKEALAQISDNGYALPYLQDGRRVMAVGARFDSQERNITEWVSCQLNQ